MLNDVRGGVERFAAATPAATLAVFSVNVAIFAAGLFRSFDTGRLCMLPIAYLSHEGVVSCAARAARPSAADGFSAFDCRFPARYCVLCRGMSCRHLQGAARRNAGTADGL